MMRPLAAARDNQEDQVHFARLRDGDRQALDALCVRHARWVRTVLRGCGARRDELDDLSQTCWLRVWQRASGLRDPARWRSWLLTIARNTARDALRKASRRRKVQQNLQDLAPAWQEGADETHMRHEERRRVLHALGELPPKDRLILMLRLVEQWSYPQIGQAMGLSLRGVETRLYRARKRLATQLKGRDE